MQAVLTRTIRALGVALLVGCSTEDGSGEVPEQRNADDSTTCRHLVEQFTRCDMLFSGTHLNGCLDDDPLLPCLSACVEDASCAQLEAAYCDQAFNAYAGCVNECQMGPMLPDFVCSDGMPIPAEFLCDNVEDCRDGEDEDCPEGKFICDDGLPIPLGWRCDSLLDCPDGEDEVDCPEGPMFTCADGVVLPASVQCDGVNDCADGYDELDCVERTCP